MIETFQGSTSNFWRLLAQAFRYFEVVFLKETILKLFFIHLFYSSGDIITFDNRRVIHARSSYVVTESDNRHLEGGYLDWDEVRSRIRVLRQKIFNQKPL